MLFSSYENVAAKFGLRLMAFDFYLEDICVVGIL